MSDTFTCVWDAIEPTPDRAREMRSRSFLLHVLSSRIQGMDDAQACQLLGATIEDVRYIRRGGINQFSQADLLTMAANAGAEITDFDGELAVVESEPADGILRAAFIAVAGHPAFQAPDRDILAAEATRPLAGVRLSR